MTPSGRISWLYTRGAESVFVFETAPLQLAVHGPGRERRVSTFAAPHDLFEFNQQYANRLAAAGFQFKGFGIERRSGRDRRRAGRGADDRRLP